MRLRFILVVVGILAAIARPGRAEPHPATAPTTQPGSATLPHLQIDTVGKRVRMECQTVNAEMALEYLVCVAGTAEHETVLRSAAKPSHLHLALLMIGLKPGEPARYLAQENKWLPPHGPRLRITCEFVKDGQTLSLPAYRLMRNLNTRQETPPITWLFTGSCMTEQGEYAADMTGNLISVVNFPFTPIDIAELKSSSNETLELEVNPDVAPKRGTTVWLVIEKVP